MEFIHDDCRDEEAEQEMENLKALFENSRFEPSENEEEETLEEGIQRTIAMIDAIEENKKLLYPKVARLTFYVFQEFIKAGFTEDHAIQLVINNTKFGGI